MLCRGKQLNSSLAALASAHHQHFSQVGPRLLSAGMAVLVARSSALSSQYSARALTKSGARTSLATSLTSLSISTFRSKHGGAADPDAQRPLCCLCLAQVELLASQGGNTCFLHEFLTYWGDVSSTSSSKAVDSLGASAGASGIQHCRSVWPEGPGLAIAWNARNAGTRNQEFLQKTKTRVDLNT